MTQPLQKSAALSGKAGFSAPPSRITPSQVPSSTTSVYGPSSHPLRNRATTSTSGMTTSMKARPSPPDQKVNIPHSSGANHVSKSLYRPLPQASKPQILQPGGNAEVTRLKPMIATQTSRVVPAKSPIVPLTHRAAAQTVAAVDNETVPPKPESGPQGVKRRLGMGPRAIGGVGGGGYSNKKFKPPTL